MEFRHLHYFVGVAETLNFRKAAQRLHISQPPLSRQIRQLEQELGVTLFARSRSRVGLTDPGRLLLPKAREVLQQLDGIAQLMAEASSGQFGHLKIGVGTSLSECIRGVVREHARRFPRIDLQYLDLPSAVQQRALRHREIDVGFLRTPIDAQHLSSEPLFTERFLVIVPQADSLAKRKVLRLKDIAGKNLLLTQRSRSCTHDQVLRLYRRAGITPNVVHTTSLAEASGANLVALGKGIYIIPGRDLRRRKFSDGVVAIPLDEPSSGIEVRIAWRRDETSAIVLNFIQTARDAFPDRTSLSA
jgi:DNA-binding transcriptional LysR family regulator